MRCAHNSCNMRGSIIFFGLPLFTLMLSQAEFAYAFAAVYLITRYAAEDMKGV